MERLWAPWRLRYIQGEKDERESAPSAETTGCIFCDKPREAEDQDAKNLIVWRGEHCFVIMNAYPYNNGHLMVVPYRHLSHPAALSEEESAVLMQTASGLTAVLDTLYRSDGYNIGMNVGSAAGAGIAAHLHLHIVPRWSGDTNFMPVVGEVKVLPETLDVTWQKITDALHSADGKDWKRNES